MKRRLLSWKKREENLSSIKRYHKFKVMFYRTDDLLHSRRVSSMVKEFSPLIKDVYPNFRAEESLIIAEHHDDHEIVMEKGDVPLQLKLLMTDEELNSLHLEELSAVDLLAENYPKIVKGYEYKKLLLSAVYKDSPEAQFVSFLDKIDGYCEAIHEVLAGNNVFLEPVINYNMKTFNDLKKRFPLIKEVFSSEYDLFNFGVVDLRHFFDHGNVGSSPHNEETVFKRTEIFHYEEWKRVTIKNFGLEPLIKQKEFHKSQKQTT